MQSTSLETYNNQNHPKLYRFKALALMHIVSCRLGFMEMIQCWTYLCHIMMAATTIEPEHDILPNLLRRAAKVAPNGGIHVYEHSFEAPSAFISYPKLLEKAMVSVLILHYSPPSKAYEWYWTGQRTGPMAARYRTGKQSHCAALYWTVWTGPHMDLVCDPGWWCSRHLELVC